MKNFNYNFKLTEEEYLEYLRYVVSFTKGSKIRNLWLRFSIPLLVVLTLFYFREYLTYFYIMIGMAIALFWFFNFSSKIINSFLHKKIDRSFKANFKIKEFSTVNTLINDDCIILDKKKIDYPSISNLMTLTSSLAIFYDFDKAFIIPYRVIGDKDKLNELVSYIDDKRKIDDE